MTGAHALGLNPPGFQPQLCNFLVAWASLFPSLRLSFPISNKGIMPPPSACSSNWLRGHGPISWQGTGHGKCQLLFLLSRMNASIPAG